MGKIIISELIRMRDEGIQGREIAAAMGVSPSAVCQALSKLAKAADRPAIFDSLTDKEIKFSIEMAKGSSQTHAALIAFDGNRESSKVMGCRLMQKPEIKEAIGIIMGQEGLGNRELCRRLKQHVHSDSAPDSLRAIDMAFKINGTYAPTKAISAHVDVSPVDLSRFQ